MTASADEIQAKLTEGLDSAAEMNDLFLLNIAKRGVKKLTQEEIVQRLQQGGQVSFEAQEMMVNTIEVRQP